MDRVITLAIDVEAAPDRLFAILSRAEGQRGFWTSDCDVSTDRARFGFDGAPVDLEVDVTTDPGKLVRMTVRSGFPHWKGSKWEWELTPATSPGTGALVLFRHYDFEPGYGKVSLGHTAETWALILDRLASFIVSG